jgi:hypothetical protein
MNSFQKLLACLMVVAITFSYSCNNDDDDPVGCNWAAEVQDEVNALNAAAEAWGADPTNAVKCQAYKDAAQAYLDDLEAHVECATLSGDEQELQDAIDASQASVDAIQC